MNDAGSCTYRSVQSASFRARAAGFEFAYETVEEAVAHPYLESLHDEVDEPCAESPFTFDFEDGAQYLTDTDVRGLIYDELCALSAEFEAAKLAQLSLGGDGQDEGNELSELLL